LAKTSNHASSLPKSPLGKARTYLLNQKQALERYLDDGRLPIDNTVVEREMKPIILGRKNWLFAGNFEAAERLADGLTVLATARMHDVDPVAYLAWLLPQLARRDWSDEQILAHLLPASFKEALEQSGQRGAGGDGSHTAAP
jgi:transposase